MATWRGVYAASLSSLVDVI